MFKRTNSSLELALLGLILTNIICLIWAYRPRKFNVNVHLYSILINLRFGQYIIKDPDDLAVKIKSRGWFNVQLRVYSVVDHPSGQKKTINVLKRRRMLLGSNVPFINLKRGQIAT